jgi:kynurenine 3-monooxygenase
VDRKNSEEIVIVGGGLVGSLLAIFLARRGFRVVVHERRADLRGADGPAGRSINLVVTSRGVRALSAVGLWERALPLSVPVIGRLIHSTGGGLAYQPYGRDESECNYSVSRLELNRFLVTEAASRGVEFRFESRLLAADLERGRLTFADDTGAGSEEVDAPVVIGADGARSALRKEMMKLPGSRESVESLDYGYKELTIPSGPQGDFRIERNTLHVWPRCELMLMALPNWDGSFTVTLYLPTRGATAFTGPDDAGKVVALFNEQFPDAIPLIPDLERCFFANPTGNLATVRCSPWHVGGRALLVGDAAHAIVPFFGQGMNCGFEDCTVLDGLIEEHGPDWETLFPIFDRARKPNADAIAEMALENFDEMRDHVGDRRFRLRKEVEHRLETEWPGEYRSRYSMVMYSDIPYEVARRAGRVQHGILETLCEGLEEASALDMTRARSLVRERLTPLLDSAGVDLDY